MCLEPLTMPILPTFHNLGNLCEKTHLFACVYYYKMTRTFYVDTGMLKFITDSILNSPRFP